MASTNVDTLLNPQSSSTKTNVAPKLRSTYFSRRTNNYNSSGSFNNVFDKVSSAPQQSSAPRDSSYRSSTVESTTRTSYNANRSAQQPSQPSAQQSAQKAEPKASTPDNVKQSEPIEPIEQPEPVDVDQPDEVDEAPSQSTPQMPLEMSALFSTSTESLLAVRETPSNDEPVLMTVMPQQSSGNSQSMLNMLTGNNWLQPSTTDQPPVVEPEQLIPAVEELLAQLSDELGPIQTDVVEPELQPQSIEPIV
ncbi:MAG: hypothetical protein IJU71_05225, partial [Selenomonadaceae bacterium]|nr:hypothetical protein [Selenomonadaceae bacterium]